MSWNKQVESIEEAWAKDGPESEENWDSTTEGAEDWKKIPTNLSLIDNTFTLHKPGNSDVFAGNKIVISGTFRLIYGPPDDNWA